MIELTLCLKDDGRLVSCSASGHAGYAEAGADIVCAAASILLRTAAESLSRTGRVEVSAPSRGVFGFVVDEGMGEAAAFAGLFLQCGLSGLAREYPEYVLLHEKRLR